MTGIICVFFLKKKEQQDEGDGNAKNQIVEFHDIRQGEQKDTDCRKGRPALPDRAEQEMHATLRQHQPRQTTVGKAGKKQQRQKGKAEQNRIFFSE